MRARFAFRVQNTSDILDDFTVILRDIDERWYSLESGSKLLFPGEDREVALASAPDGWVTASVPATVPAVVPETHPVGPGMNISAD